VLGGLLDWLSSSLLDRLLGRLLEGIARFLILEGHCLFLVYRSECCTVGCRINGRCIKRGCLLSLGFSSKKKSNTQECDQRYGAR